MFVLVLVLVLAHCYTLHPLDSGHREIHLKFSTDCALNSRALNFSEESLALLTLGSWLSMLNHRTEAQALCCWLEFEMITTGRDEAWGEKTKQNQYFCDS